MTLKILDKIKNCASLWRIFLLDIVFPIECVSCSKGGSWLCDDCYNKISIKQTQQCILCGKNNLLGSFCKKCKDNHCLGGIMIASDYDDKLLSQTIKSYKYKLVKDLSTPLSQLLIDLVSQILDNPENNYFWHGADKKIINNFSNHLVIPVPLYLKRQKWRGFNQSEELAKRFAKYFTLEINSQNLKRIKFIKPQTRLNKNERFENIKNSFSWNGESLNKKNIILIDDVITSTATLNECAKILKKNGAGKIWGLVIAHG